MKDSIKEKLGVIPRNFWILSVIIFLGIFLRAYNFHDWLLFSPDQARDASLVTNALVGKGEPILLGAQAGNTQFHLGPFYYQLEYLAGVIFGTSPDKFAYPDLLFSILTIPALFLLLKKYFSDSIALSLSFLYSVAYFSIFTARFAVNSNSLSFFMVVFLYGLLEMMDEKNKNKHIWAAVVGSALGIGIQLHALAFIVMPLVALVSCIYMVVKKNLTWKSFLLVILFVLITNFGQLSYEIRTNGSNIRQFFRGAGSGSSELSKDFSEKISLASYCQIRSSMNQISSLDVGKYCDQKFELEKTLLNYKKSSYMVSMIELATGVIFTIGGYWILLSRLFNKKFDSNKKEFLWLLLLSNVFFLALIVSLVSQAEVHYFNFIFFVPFVLLGLWVEIIKGSGWRVSIKQGVIILLIAALFFCNTYTLNKKTREYISSKASDSETSILGEIIPVAGYIVEKSNGLNRVYLDGDKLSTHRFFSPLGFITAKSGVEIAKWRDDNKPPIEEKNTLFYIKMSGADLEKNKNAKTIGGKSIKEYKKFGNIIIYILDK